MLQVIPIIFCVGYLFIVLEHKIKVNKSASALLTGVLCWVVYIFVVDDKHLVNEKLLEHLGEVSGILFFLMGAMTIVELIDAHDGFEIITNRIQTTSKRRLLWIVAFITFFMSAVLDNLTTTIVMVSLIRKLLTKRNDKLFFVGLVVIAANAGGAWSPIGDVTTTMLWIGGQITSFKIITHTFLPSLVCLLIPLLIISIGLKGEFTKPQQNGNKEKNVNRTDQLTVFLLGIGSLVFVPVFKTITHLPPYMGILFGLGVMWFITEIIHNSKDERDKNSLSVLFALRKIDIPSILFFLGILLAISAMQTTGFLANFASVLDQNFQNQNIVVILIGFISSVVDNVPIVAAVMGMYDLSQLPGDSSFWLFLAYCAGTGGSALIIGSAAGVAAMGMEKIDFFWYIRKISLWAVIGYVAGAFVFIWQMQIFTD